jgi:hypothetical protein
VTLHWPSARTKISASTALNFQSSTWQSMISKQGATQAMQPGNRFGHGIGLACARWAAAMGLEWRGFSA